MKLSSRQRLNNQVSQLHKAIIVKILTAHLFLGGQEYIYVSQSTQNTHAGSEDPVVVLEKRVSRLENVLLKPLEAAFKEA